MYDLSCHYSQHAYYHHKQEYSTTIFNELCYNGVNKKGGINNEKASHHLYSPHSPFRNRFC